MNAGNELRVWAGHLAGQSLTVFERAVPFDSAGRSAPLTAEEFDCLMRIDCFSSDGPLPSTRDFIPAAFTPAQWLCFVGLSSALVESLTDPQQETLALDLRGLGSPFNTSNAEFAAWAQGQVSGSTLPTPEEVQAGIEWAEHNYGGGEALPDEGECPEPSVEEVEAGGFQHPDAAAVLGLEEPVGEVTDLLAQFAELKPDAREELVLEGGLTRQQLDTLFNTEGDTKGLKSKKVLNAIATALQRLPNPTADSINNALLKASAQEN